MGSEWSNTGSAENVPLIMRAATTCESGIDVSGITNIYRRAQVRGPDRFSREAQPLDIPAVVTVNKIIAADTANKIIGVDDAKAGTVVAENAGYPYTLRNQPIVEILMEIDGPQAQNGGPGYLAGFFWAVVNMTVSSSLEGIGRSAATIMYAIDASDELLNCTSSLEYTRPIFLATGYNESYDAPVRIRIRALACLDGKILSQQERGVELVPGPYLTIATNISNVTNYSELNELGGNGLVTAACSVLAISFDVLCNGQVSLLRNFFAGGPSLSGMNVVVKVLAVSNIEAAAWRKALLLQEILNVSESSGVVSAVHIESVNVTVPVPNWRLIPVTEPCTSHYDCASEPTGQQLVNGENITQYGWGRSFCAIWGSSVTNGVGPTCDSCRLYCTAASLSSVDGICPENCGTPWSGTLPPCLSAQILEDNYNCDSRHRFELWQHSSPGNSPPNPQISSVSYRRTMSPFNNILGAVVVTQTRASTVTCLNGGNERLTSFTSAHSVTCVGPPASNRNGSGGYGVDPTFQVFSTLFDGKETAEQYYNGQQIPDLQSSPQTKYNGVLEGYFTSDGTFVPYGFFPHWWDQVQKHIALRTVIYFASFIKQLNYFPSCCLVYYFIPAFRTFKRS